MHPEYWQGVNVITDPTWGDNGKGKYVDYAGYYADLIIRYNGADNAGHSIDTGVIKMVSHSLPSGLLVAEREDKERPLNIISGGALVNPFNVVKEINEFRANGIEVEEDVLMIHSRSHLIMPWHIMRDKLSEVSRGGEKIGTTGRGIGPTYADRTDRVGLRVSDLYRPDFEELFMKEFAFQERMVRMMAGELLAGEIEIPESYTELDFAGLQNLVADIKEMIENGTKHSSMDPEAILEGLHAAADVLQPMVQNVLPVIREAHRNGKNITGEAGQGGILDIEQGTYPFVTSSHPGVTGFSLATNIHAQDVNNVLGVQKAYFTRVGGGPMPTEDFGPLGTQLREKGHEYGATTGRPRKCGPMDIPALKWGLDVTGTRRMGITKIDVLDDFDTIPVCVAYDVGSQRYHEVPEGDAEFFAAAKPVYIQMPGWKEPTTECRSFEELPRNAQEYIGRIEELTGKGVDWVGVGPERDATIYNG